MRVKLGVRRKAVQRTLARRFKEREIVLVVVEGKTELRYLQGLRMHHRDMGYNLQIEIAPSKHYSDLVEAAKEIRKKYQDAKVVSVICLGDQEENGPAITRKLREMVALADSYGFICVVSNPHIESWFLQHFEKVSSSRSKQSIEDRLKKQFIKNRLGQYGKPPKSDIYTKLLPNQSTALRNGQHVPALVSGMKTMAWLIKYLTDR